MSFRKNKTQIHVELPRGKFMKSELLPGTFCFLKYAGSSARRLIILYPSIKPSCKSCWTSHRCPSQPKSPVSCPSPLTSDSISSRAWCTDELQNTRGLGSVRPAAGQEEGRRYRFLPPLPSRKLRVEKKPHRVESTRPSAACCVDAKTS